MNVRNVARTETEYQFDHIIKLASGHPPNADDLAEVATLQDPFVISGTGTRQCVVWYLTRGKELRKDAGITFLAPNAGVPDTERTFGPLGSILKIIWLGATTAATVPTMITRPI